MDRKTLEYMEERAKKGRDIARRIDFLKDQLNKMYGVRVVSLLPEKQSEIRFAEHVYGERFVKSATTAISEEIKKEIELLEQELAEL